MKTIRKKIIDLLDEFPVQMEWHDNADLANFLLSHGVTVQEWISVKDRLPESEKDAVLIALRWGEVDIGWCEDEKWGSEFVNEYDDGEVTHWMPLPQPPKGE